MGDFFSQEDETVFYSVCGVLETNPTDLSPLSLFFVIASDSAAIQFIFPPCHCERTHGNPVFLLCHCERTRGNPVDALLLQSQIYWIAAVVTLPRNDKFLSFHITNIFPYFSFVTPIEGRSGANIWLYYLVRFAHTA